MEQRIDALRNRYIVCGMERVGQQVRADLEQEGVQCVALEMDAAALPIEESDRLAIVGDAKDDDTLRQAGIDRARGLVAATGDDADNLFITVTAHALKPDLVIVARANEPSTQPKLIRAGAAHVIAPYIIAGRRIATQLLHPSLTTFLDLIMYSGDLEMWIDEYPIDEQSDLMGRTVTESEVRRRTGANVLAVHRQSLIALSRSPPLTSSWYPATCSSLSEREISSMRSRNWRTPADSPRTVTHDQRPTMSSSDRAHASEPTLNNGLSRRRFMAYFSSVGLGGSALPAILWSLRDQEGQITSEMIAQAEKLAGLQFTEAERDLMLEDVNENLASYQQLRTTAIPNEIHPAVVFDPLLPGHALPSEASASQRTRIPDQRRPVNDQEVSFLTVTELGELVRTRQVSSEELTRLYLDRLTRHCGKLECVITLTEGLALRQARRADAELARGVYRGPLHGIPWGAKDLLAEDEYRTTGGAKPYEDQVIGYDATVVHRLEEAGAVLAAKLTLGALAWGDVWFGGQTRNPWNPDEGSSGSSAGSASATAAGLVGFSIGSETLGSIVSPSTRCGATGLRPTFGRVSRWGAMALSWSMDKLGPICRSVEDCALVFDAIHGADGKDPSARTVPFAWRPVDSLRALRLGYYRDAFEEEHDWKAYDDAALEVLRSGGAQLIPIDLPVDDFPLGALRLILNVEAAAAFDELTRSDRDDLLVRQIRRSWPNVFRYARLIPAVEYLQANRVRTMLMHALDATMEGIDVFITPSFGDGVLLLTNLTGHPAVTIPNGFREDGTPVSISFVGRLYGEGSLLAVAKAYQDETGFHLQHPAEFAG